MGAVDSSARPGEARAGSRRWLPRVRTGGHQRGRSGPGDASGRRASRPGAAGAGGAPAWEEQAGQHLRPPRVQAGAAGAGGVGAPPRGWELGQAPVRAASGGVGEERPAAGLARGGLRQPDGKRKCMIGGGDP